MVAEVSWQNSETRDMLWAARNTVLDTIAQMEGVEDVLDPLGCERHGQDERGDPLHGDSTLYTVEHVEIWRRRLVRTDSMLRELLRRLSEAGGEDDAAAVPDEG